MRNSLKLSAALAAIALATSLAACAKKDKPADVQEQVAEAPKTVYGTWGVDTTQGDPAVRPGDDFARYANGKWIDTFQIPADLPASSPSPNFVSTPKATSRRSSRNSPRKSRRRVRSNKKSAATTKRGWKKRRSTPPALRR